MNDPRKSKKTLGQPNYYRLGYHLAAHQVHADRARVHATSPGDDMLARWADRDPTLRALDAGASSADFRAVLAEFPWPEPASGTERDAEKDKRKDKAGKEQ